MSTIDVRETQTVEVGYDELCGALAARGLRALWSMQTQIMHELPVPTTRPWLWRWGTTYPLAKRAGELVTIERGGDRRVIAMANPGLNGLPFTSTTLWGALQYLGPGESAPAHRHTPSAVRFVLVGSGVYTTVDGDACRMEPGDLILTPNWNWHDHNNTGDEPMVWFDGLDLPLVTTLESIFFENHPEGTQPVLGHNLSEAGLDAGELAETPTGHSPLLRYRREETDRALAELQRAEGGPLVTYEYRNPVTGGPAVPTFGSSMTRLRPGARSETRRKTGSSVYVVFRGTGRTVIDGRRFDWGPGDVFVTPSWAAVDHEADEPADLFAIDDAPVLRALHLYAEETAPPQEVRDVFEPR